MLRDRSRRILIYGMNYAPELTGVGRYSGELGSWLAAKGHQVEVITTPPHYPGWWVRKPYGNRSYHRETIAGATVWRCPVWLSRTAQGIRRLLAPITFALSSAPIAAWRILRSRPDVVLCVEPTLMVAPVALLAARIVGARTLLHVQDLEIDAAFAVGHVRLPRPIRTLIFAIERRLLARFDRVVTVSVKMTRRLKAKGVGAERLRLIRNWVDTDRIQPLGRPSAYRDELGIADDDYVLLYSGQIGPKQSLHLLFEAAEALVDRPGIRIVVAGDGPLRKSFRQRYGHLPNVTLLPLQPEERLGEFLNLADCHLLPQDPAVAELVLPSKIGGMLATGKHILTTADEDSEIAIFLGDAAERAAPHALAPAIRALADKPRGDSPAALMLARTLSTASAMAEFEALMWEREGGCGSVQMISPT